MHSRSGKLIRGVPWRRIRKNQCAPGTARIRSLEFDDDGVFWLVVRGVEGGEAPLTIERLTDW